MRHAVLPLLACLLFAACQQKPIQTYPIQQGSFQQSFVETGELAAIKTWTYVMPSFGRYWYEMKIIGILDHGTEVKTGDSIIQFDPTEVNRVILDIEQELETQEANLEKMIVDQKNSVADIETNMKTEEASFSLRKLNMESSRFESERTQKIRKLEFQQSQIQYDNTRNRMKMNKIIAENDLKIQRIKVRQLRDEIKDAKAVLPQLTVRTPISGIFQIGSSRRRGELIKVGDEIYRGNSIGNVPDLTWMKVYTSVDESDFFKVWEGQRVHVRLDAIPEVSFQAEVSSIGRICHSKDNNDRQKVFDVELKLLVSDKRLRPGMTVNNEFLCEELRNVMSVPLACVETTASGSYIYLKKGATFERTEIETGPSNNTHVVIKGTVKPGELVASVNQVEHEDED